MQNRTLTLIIGILIGAAVTAGFFLIFSNNENLDDSMEAEPLQEMTNRMSGKDEQEEATINSQMENIHEKLDNAVDDLKNGTKEIGNKAENGLGTVENAIENGVNSAKNAITNAIQ